MKNLHCLATLTVILILVGVAEPRGGGGRGGGGYRAGGDFRGGGFSPSHYDGGGYRSGFDRSGYDRSSYDRMGYDRSGYDRSAYDRNGHTIYNPSTRPNWDNRNTGWNTNHPNWDHHWPWNNIYHPYHPWYNGGWNYWGYGYPVAWGAGAGWLGGTGDTYVYYNPYYDVSSDAPVSYASPLPTAPATTSTYADDGSETITATPAYVSKFDDARAAFKQGDYPKALTLVNDAIKMEPDDPVLSELRGLILFAQKNYRDAAATEYAVLAAGPGMDWTTLNSLYANTDTFTKQLRALEDYTRTNPKLPDGHFLCAYLYLVMGYKDAAMKQLEQVVQLAPDDKVSAQLLKSLKQVGAGTPAAQP